MDKQKYDHQVALELCDAATDLIRQALDKLQAAEALYEREAQTSIYFSRYAENVSRAYSHAAKARLEIPYR